jgi:hypothetical protein
MTPFQDDYAVLEDALRRTVEDKWGCQLFLARDRSFDDRILDNVRSHMDRADVFLAEVSAQNPNVMFELGAALYTDSERPVILLCRQPPGEVKPMLPADLQGFIYLRYNPTLAVNALVEELESELRKSEKLLQRLDDGEREHFFSPRRLREVSSVNLDDKQAEVLTRSLPTLQKWALATPSIVSKLSGLRPKAAEALIDDVLSSSRR